MFNRRRQVLFMVLLAVLLATQACAPVMATPTGATEVSGSAQATERTATPAEIPTPTLESTNLPAPPSVPGMATVAPPATSTPLPAPAATASPAGPALAIRSFHVATEGMETGKRLTFTWETTGASTARIVSGTSQRFARWWDVPPSGTLTVELTSTNFRDPTMALMAYESSMNGGKAYTRDDVLALG